MIRTTLNWTVKNLKAMRDEKETLSFSHPIQRQSAQWTNEQQSLLIHSMLDNFPVPSVYIHKAESVEVDAKGKHSYSYSVLDGKQRMTTVFSYIDGEYALADDTPDVTIEDTVYEIAGKYFDDLDDDVQQEILRFKFNIQAFEDVTDDIIEEIFLRLNNSTPLTKPQKAKPLMGVSNSIFINDILASRFFTDKCNFTKRQLTQSADLCTLLQGMMLLDNKYRGYDFPNISDDEAMVYSKWINGNYPDEYRCRIKKIVAFLDNLFYMKEKNLRKINIPILFLMADKALSLSISGTNFRRWFYDFFENHKEEYGQYCSSGSVKKEKTLGRINVMMESFNSYFQLQDNKLAEQETDSSDEANNYTGTELPVELDADTDSGHTDEQTPDEEPGSTSEDLSDEEPAETEQELTEEPAVLSEEEPSEEIENPNESDRKEPTEEADGFTAQETDITEDNVEQGLDEYEQETGESFSEDLQKGANESNDTDFEDAPDAENVDSKVSSNHEDFVSNNSFFSTMAAKFHSLVV